MQVTTITPQDRRTSRLSMARILKLDALRGGGEMDAVDLAVLKTTNTEWKRHRFLDMYLYNRLASLGTACCYCSSVVSHSPVFLHARHPATDCTTLRSPLQRRS